MQILMNSKLIPHEEKQTVCLTRAVLTTGAPAAVTVTMATFLVLAEIGMLMMKIAHLKPQTK
ncbi:hypothetical protein BaRGS_00015153, partial [Batillaria attramentaria]